jgi:Ca2+-binding RTX toxin-like protein
LEMPLELEAIKSVRTSVVPEIAVQEQDGSVGAANWTGLSAGIAGVVQANGYIGDSPTIATVGDRDAFRFELAAGWTVRLNVDAAAFRSNQQLDPIVQIYNTAGVIVAINDDYDPADGLDSFVSFTNGTGVTQTYTAFISSLNLVGETPDDPNSGSGGIDQIFDRGAYRLFINTFNPADVTHGQILMGTSAAEIINGTSGNDIFEGTLGNDDLNGGGGNDVFRWDRRDGSPRIDGGGSGQINVLDAMGNELAQVYTVTSNGSGFHLSVSDPQGTSSAQVLQAIHRLDVHGREGNDTLNVNSLGNDLNGGTITFWGDEGNDTLNAAGINANFIVHSGTGNDNVVTGALADDIFGSDGDDVMNGGAGVDTVNYSLFGRDVTVNLTLTGAQDTRGAGVDTILNIENAIGGSGWDTLIGTTASNTLIGGDGNDALFGGVGAANTLQGGRGDDRYLVEAVGETIVEFGNEGTDEVQTNLASFNLAANVENLINTGGNRGAGVDFTGVGNGLDNRITGGSGDDYLIGQGGNDTLIDESGLNTLQGGAGNDIYAVGSNSDTVFEFANQGIDQVQTYVTFYQLSANVEHLVFVGNVSHTGVGTNTGNTFTGAGGDDTWTGNGGLDVYVRGVVGGGLDTITDFDAENVSAGHDTIDLRGLGTNFAALSVTPVSGGTTIGIPGGGAVFLQGVASGSVDAGDFFF